MDPPSVNIHKSYRKFLFHVSRQPIPVPRGCSEQRFCNSVRPRTQSWCGQCASRIHHCNKGCWCRLVSIVRFIVYTDLFKVILWNKFLRSSVNLITTLPMKFIAVWVWNVGPVLALVMLSGKGVNRYHFGTFVWHSLGWPSARSTWYGCSAPESWREIYPILAFLLQRKKMGSIYSPWWWWCWWPCFQGHWSTKKIIIVHDSKIISVMGTAVLLLIFCPKNFGHIPASFTFC